MLLIGHNAFATVGLVVVAVLALVLGEPQLRQGLETNAYEWLQSRNDARMEAQGNTLYAVAEPDAVARATATDIKELTPQQARLAAWISRRYRVATEPVSALVREAYETGKRTRLDPTLILAVMAVESRFNPFAQSPVGAQGLMQVLTRVHDDKYENFGGTLAAFDPITNLRVGVQVLKESIRRGGGTVEEGLRHYVGAALLDDDRGYASKVMAEQTFMKQVVGGRQVAANVQAPPAVPRPALVPVAPALPAAPAIPAQAAQTTGTLAAAPMHSHQLAQVNTAALVR